MSHSDFHFDFNVLQENIEDDFQKILVEIRPTWHKKHVIYQPIAKDYSQGLLNVMVKCFNGSMNPKDAIMVRIVNDKLDFMLNRKMEISCVKYFKKFEFAPKLLATFKNGYCYQFIEGEILNSTRLSEEPIWRRIAENLAVFHSGRIENCDKKGVQCDMFVNECFKKYPNEFKDPKKNEILKRDLPSKMELEEELTYMRDHCAQLKSPIVVCHNDTRGENFIWNEKTGILSFVDFECCEYNNQAAEIAWHFLRYCGFTPADYSLYPTNEFELKWLQYYLEKYNEFNKIETVITSTDVYALYVQVAKYHLYYLIGAVVMGVAFDFLEIVDPKLMDMLEYAVGCCKEYYKEKSRIINMKMP